MTSVQDFGVQKTTSKILYVFRKYVFPLPSPRSAIIDIYMITILPTFCKHFEIKLKQTLLTLLTIQYTIYWIDKFVIYNITNFKKNSR